MRTLRCYPESWPLHSAFVISRGSRTEAKVVVVEIEEAGIHAFGECTPYPHYGESESSVMAQLALVASAVEQGVSREGLQQLLPAGAARNAVDCALWQLESWQKQQSLWQLTQDCTGRPYLYGPDCQYRDSGSDGVQCERIGTSRR